MSDYEGVSSDESEELNFNNDESDDSSSEEEVLPVCLDSESESYDSGDEANISESDINDNDDDDLPNLKAWGRNKNRYYNGDNINDKTNRILNEEDEEDIKLEEEEALAIQKRLVSKIDDADLALDLLDDVVAENEENEAIFHNRNDKVEIDLSQMNEQEKLELLEKASPELMSFIEEYKALMTCVHDELIPAIGVLKKNKSRKYSAGQFIQIYTQLVMNYCTNILFYLLLKSRKMDVKSHPSYQWLEKYKRMVDETRPTYEEVFKPQIKLIMRNDFKSLSRINRKRKLSTATKSETINSASVPMEWTAEDDLSEDNDSTDVHATENNLDDEGETDGKRAITYQIAKNKGLTPHRKKELRNPRVKHRMKYRKAKIRRKGQVREVRKEVRKYDGEMSGIKTNVVKSVKFKA